MPPQLEPDNCGNYVVQDSTTKNDCAEQNGCISCSLDDGDDCCRKLYEESMQDLTTKNDIRDNRVKNELNRVKDELEPITKNCESCRYYGSHHEVCNYCYKCSLWTEKELTTKNDLGVDCIDRAQAQTEIEMNALRYTIAKERGGMGQVEWSDQLIKVSDAVDIIRNLPPVTPQEPRWIPVTEKLPEEKTAVLLSCDDMYLAKLNPCIGWISGNNWYTFSARGSYLVKYPVAWMPLPEPYKGGQEE